METLAGRMSQKEFFNLALILARPHARVRDENGRTRIDVWVTLTGL